MNKIMRVFTVSSGVVTHGAEIGVLHLKGAGVDVPAIIIGEEGRGRERGVVPVANPPKIPCAERGKKVWTSSEVCSQCGMPLGHQDENYRFHSNNGEVVGRLMFAEIGETKTGKPKFFSKGPGTRTDDDYVILIFLTKIGFRGSNSHTGDRAGWKCSCGEVGEGKVPAKCPKCEAEAVTFGYGGPKMKFAEFPGRIIAKGTIAQGDAGRMGSGENLIAVIPKNLVFRTGYSGRLYGKSAAHYYLWDGENVVSATWEERTSADLF